jgi:predicted helicase
MHYIQNYYRRLDDLRRIAGASNEGSLRQAFEELLRNIGEEHQLILCPEYQFESFKSQAKSHKLRVDGVLVDRLRLVHGWWEAKDEKDDLDKEIQVKLDKGYPSDNIIFEDTRQAVLFQNGQEVMRCQVSEKYSFQKLLDLFFAYELPEVKIFREARDKFSEELPSVVQELKELLQEAHASNETFNKKVKVFLALCHDSIGEQVTIQHVDEMIIQHILTNQAFYILFPISNFYHENHLVEVIRQLERSFFYGTTRFELLKRLEPYFIEIRRAAVNTVTFHEKQTFLKQVYEDFYNTYNAKDADKLGIVYTPQEVVRFIIEGCDWLTQQHFYKRLIDKDLEILDPCTGTGTFIVDLLEYWRGENRDAIKYKFEKEMHANEISILPYYVAYLNIEQSFCELMGKWSDFKGLCFMNTLDNVGFKQIHKGTTDDLFGGITHENRLRIQEQNQRKIPVIMANPPYNANQKNENDNNKNDVAQFIDVRIKDTYLAESNAQKTKLYDPYVRFFRWASDRLGKQGVLGFITNRSYLDKRSFDGFRKIVEQEFQEIWLVDLLGDLRERDSSLNQGGNIFNIQTGVAIGFFVRNPNVSGCEIHYIHAPEGTTGIEKLRWLKSSYLQKLAKTGQFERIKPNPQGLWLNQPTADWSEWLPVATKDVKAGKSEKAIFKLFSLGVVTNRDDWVYDFSKRAVVNKIKAFIKFYNEEQARWEKSDKLQDIESFVQRDIKWTSELTAYLTKGTKLKYQANSVVSSAYRPFVNKFLYYGKILVHRTYQHPLIFPIQFKDCENTVICFSSGGRSKGFACYATNIVPSLDIFLPDANNCLPLYQYSADGTREENITDWALMQFHEYYKTQDIEKIDIFHYVYAILHDPRYRETFALNLKQESPRIPFYPEFDKWAKIGKQLLDLHINFEQVEPYPLQQIDKKITVTPKCKLKADKNNNTIELDSETTLENIPPEAWQYQLGNRSALEWILDQYKEKKPRDATIREKFDTYKFADYKQQVIELLKKVCHVSVETMKLIEQIETLKND